MTDLVSYLTRQQPATGEEVTVSSADLERLWSALIPQNSFATRRGRDAFLDAIQARAGEDSGTNLEFRPGGWQVDMHKGLVQSVVAGALIAGLLVVLGSTQIPAALVPTIIPLFFDVEKVRLTAGQEHLLAEIVARSERADGSLTIDELYGQLPAPTRDAVSHLDFVDFIEACRRAGVADVAPDDTVALRALDQATFRVTLR
ncbi:MAG: hypothetical protein QG597_4656 [Actinomycetota bacterium]|nr:hypothetical protein [Actinomycetota bacterium]